MRFNHFKSLCAILMVLLLALPSFCFAEQTTEIDESIDNKYIDWDLWIEISSIKYARCKLLVNDSSDVVYEPNSSLSVNTGDMLTILPFPQRACQLLYYTWDDEKKIASQFVFDSYATLLVPDSFEVGSTHSLHTWMYFSGNRAIWSNESDFDITIIGKNENPLDVNNASCRGLVWNHQYDYLINDGWEDSIWLSDYIILKIYPIEGKEFSKVIYQWDDHDPITLDVSSDSGNVEPYINNLANIYADGEKHGVTLHIFVELDDGTVVPQGEKTVVFTYDFRYFSSEIYDFYHREAGE